jgi:flagellar assembly protein FliH
MSSSSSPARIGAWTPALDLTPAGLSRFDPARVQQAIDDGYAAGFDAGRAEALARAQAALDAEVATARAQVQALVASVGRAVDAVHAAEAEAAGAVARHAAEVAVALAEAILGRELAEPSVAAVAAAERALAALDRRAAVVLRLHPDDIELVDAGALPAEVRVVADAGLARGDAVAETDDRTVDARVGAALQRALAVLSGAEAPA